MMIHPALMLEVTRGVTADRIRQAGQRATIDTGRGLIDQLIVMCVYREWKEAAADVSVACARCSDAAATDRDLALAAYGAALDREESAANAYADRVASLATASSRTA